MKLKSILVFLLILVAIGGLGTGAYQYQQRQSPAYVLQQAGEALVNKDQQQFTEAVDVNTFIESGYDEGSALLAENIQTLHAAYPADPFFDHSSSFMRQYTAAHRAQSLAFMQQVIKDYFAGPNPDLTFDEDRPQWLAAQLIKMQQSSRVKLSKIEEKGDKAYATLTFSGDASAYGQLLNKASVVLELNRSQGRWKISRIANGPDLLYPAAKGAEDFWTLQGWQ